MPQTWNRYAYSGNNPLKYVDPSGNYFVLANEKDRRFFAAAIAKGTRHENARDLFLQLARDPNHSYTLSTGRINQGRTSVETGNTLVFPTLGSPNPTGAVVRVDPGQYGKISYQTPTVTVFHEFWHIYDEFYNQSQMRKKHGDESDLTTGKFSVFETLGYRADVLTDDAAHALTADQVSAYLQSYYSSLWAASRVPTRSGSLDAFFNGSFLIEGIMLDWSDKR